MKICKATLHWEQISGLLVKRDGYYRGRCPLCRRSVQRKAMPKLGAVCGAKKK